MCPHIYSALKTDGCDNEFPIVGPAYEPMEGIRNKEKPSIFLEKNK